MSIIGRALHYVFKIGDRSKTIFFFRNILGMKVLRHEEFNLGCEALCNGPYDNRWSKTMVGYGPESSHFVIELTYNYGVKSYELGNDFSGITIQSNEAIQRAKQHNYPMEQKDGFHILKAPDGYTFFLINELQPENSDPVLKVALNSSNIQESQKYWEEILQMKLINKQDKTILLSYGEKQASLELKELSEPLNRAKAYGRIAFAVPLEVQPKIDDIIKGYNGKILTPLISLDTPGKATVRVIILADPDGHEICFVDEGGFSQLSQVDPEADLLLNKNIDRDPFAKN